MKTLKIASATLAVSLLVGSMMLPNRKVRAGVPSSVKETIRNTICSTAQSRIGYEYSQKSPDGPTTFDCGGLVRYCIRKARGSQVRLSTDKNSGCEWTAADDYRLLENQKMTNTNPNSLAKGEFIYYKKSTDNHRYKRIYHAAVYVGNGQIVDATSSAGKVVPRERSHFNINSEVGYVDVTATM